MDLSELRWFRNKKDIKNPRIVRILIPKKKKLPAILELQTNVTSPLRIHKMSLKKKKKKAFRE